MLAATDLIVFLAWAVVTKENWATHNVVHEGPRSLIGWGAMQSQIEVQGNATLRLLSGPCTIGQRTYSVSVQLKRKRNLVKECRCAQATVEI